MNIFIRPVIEIASVFICLFIGSTSALAATLNVTIDDLRSDRGDVLIAVFKKGSGFPRHPEDAVFKTSVPAKSGTLALEVPDLINGEYAVALHHDENGDRKMNYSFIGIPKEGFGFSGNKKIYFGPPSFASAKVDVGANPTSIDIKMKYF